MNTKIKPLGDMVVISPEKSTGQTSSGIIIPDTAKEAPQKGLVMAVGPGKPDMTMEVDTGDTVLYRKNSGTTVTLDDEDFLIVNLSDIYAIL